MTEVFVLGRGTSPYIELEVVGLDLSICTVLELTFEQEGVVEITKRDRDIKVKGNLMEVHFTQEETLRFRARQRAYVQLRAKIGEESVNSDIVSIIISDVLRDGPIF